MADQLQPIADQLLTLSSDKDSQPIIARDDGCLRALISFITTPVALTALSALSNLASHPDNYSLLRSEDDLMQSLRSLLLQDTASTSVDIKRAAYALLEELSDEHDVPELDELAVRSGLKKGNEDAQEVRLKVPGLSDDIMSIRVQQLIMRKRGVISVGFEMAREVVVVFGRTPAEELKQFVSTMTGKNVTILENEEAGEDENDRCDVNHGRGYLDERGERLRDVARRGKKKRTVTQGASSLHERLRAQRERGARRNRQGRVMSSFGMRDGWSLW